MTSRREIDKESMVTRKAVFSILTAAGLLALSSTAAHAGAGGTPSALKSFFVCHSITGAAPEVTPVDIYSDEVGTPVNRTNITIGQAILACAQAWFWPAGTVNPKEGTDISPKIPEGTGFKQLFELKCYTAEGPGRKTGQTTAYSAEDALSGSQPVQGSPDVRMICGPAGFSQPSQ